MIFLFFDNTTSFYFLCNNNRSPSPYLSMDDFLPEVYINFDQKPNYHHFLILSIILFEHVFSDRDLITQKLYK